MRHEDQSHVLFAACVPQEVDHRLLIARIDVGSRLVGQQELRTICQRAGYGNPLLLAHREHRRLMRQTMGQAHPIEQMTAPGGIDTPLPKGHTEKDILQRGESQGRRLKV